MSSPEERERRQAKRRRENAYAKALRDSKGPFSPKIKPGKKGEPYKRDKLNINEIALEVEDNFE